MGCHKLSLVGETEALYIDNLYMGLFTGQIKTGSLIVEVEDSYISDITMGLCTGQIQTETPCRGDMTTK